MGPIPAEVHQDPLLHAVLLHREPERVAIHELAVDGPLAVQAVELEGPDGRGHKVGARERVKLLLRWRQTVVDDLSASHSELQQQIAAAGGQNRRRGGAEHLGAFLRGAVGAEVVYRALAVEPVQPAFQVNSLAGELAARYYDC